MLAALGQRDAERARGDVGDVEEQFLEIAHRVKQQARLGAKRQQPHSCAAVVGRASVSKRGGLALSRAKRVTPFRQMSLKAALAGDGERVSPVTPIGRRVLGKLIGHHVVVPTIRIHRPVVSGSLSLGGRQTRGCEQKSRSQGSHDFTRHIRLHVVASVEQFRCGNPLRGPGTHNFTCDGDIVGGCEIALLDVAMHLCINYLEENKKRQYFVVNYCVAPM